MTLAMHVVWDFTIDSRHGDVELFHLTGERLLDELVKLEELNEFVTDPAVSTEADRGVIVVELVTSGPDYATALQRAFGHRPYRGPRRRRSDSWLAQRW